MDELIALLLAIAAYWGIVAGIVWLICLCFGWAFSLKIATGVFLAMLLVAMAGSK